MNTNSNQYTIKFAIIMVVIVALILSFVAITLKEAQNKNKELEKKQNILKAIGVKDISREQSNLEYNNYIKKEIVLNYKGEKINEYRSSYIDSLTNLSDDESLKILNEINKTRAFSIKLKKEIKLPLEEQKFPLYIGIDNNNEEKYIIPLEGKGLWGPIWGFISLNPDLNTVFAAVYDHKAETPGLGAEINTSWFQERFIGKEIYENSSNKLVSIEVTKKEISSDDYHKVNGISGGTITSDGVTNMLLERLSKYDVYFQKLNQEKKDIEDILELEDIKDFMQENQDDNKYIGDSDLKK
ncbi:MAG: NADH:ubiquinone reductase (Na(+)-transporting) subunit C [Flavobacteriales bacterium]|nr:NADH:ubiquinone reductase (Na(+)-transporting) subunit C [Flavobacteriales bacterium]|tara:strand:- start:12 stop:905 length:894 start_codon:yes stop_codon:yes gene_type:complete